MFGSLPSSGRSSSVLFLPSSIPFPTFPTCPYVKVGPGAIEGADSSDDEAMQSRRTPATRRKKIIRDPDSESESELSVPTSSHRASVTLCDSDSEGDDDVEEEETVYDIAKHYDESYGSLRDFIVDDDDDEYDTGGIDSGTSGEDDGDCHPRRQDPPGRRPALASSGLETLSLDDSPPSKPSLNKAKSGTKQSRREWEAEREQIGADIFTDLDQRVFGGRLRGSKIEWGNRLLTTAGTATSIKYAELWTRVEYADGQQDQAG